MNHYRQIIINLSVDDDCEEKKIEDLTKQVESFIAEQVKQNIPEVKEISTRMN